jgi:L,D-transpeptidase-like protein
LALAAKSPIKFSFWLQPLGTKRPRGKLLPTLACACVDDSTDDSTETSVLFATYAGGALMRLSQFFLTSMFVVGGAAFGSAAQANVLIVIDKSAQSMSVAIDGTTRWTWPVSTGAAGHETPSGTFQPFRMEATHFSKEWDDAPMPHSIFFTKIGHAIHGTYDAGHLGTAASHGCVRLSTANAAQLFQLVKQEGVLNTKVVVSGQQPYGAPEADNSYRQNWSNQNSYGQNWFGQNSYDQSNRNQNGYNHNSYSNNWFGQNSGSSGQRGNPQSNYRRDGSYYDQRY